MYDVSNEIESWNEYCEMQAIEDQAADYFLSLDFEYDYDKQLEIQMDELVERMNWILEREALADPNYVGSVHHY